MSHDIAPTVRFSPTAPLQLYSQTLLSLAGVVGADVAQPRLFGF